MWRFREGGARRCTTHESVVIVQPLTTSSGEERGGRDRNGDEGRKKKLSGEILP